MRLSEFTVRLLILDKEDKVDKVLVTNRSGSNHFDRSAVDLINNDNHDKLVLSCTECVLYNKATVDTMVLYGSLDSKATINSDDVTVNTIHIEPLASVYIKARHPNIHAIHIQSRGCLHITPEFLRHTNNIVLNFEEEAVLYVGDKMYTYRGYKDPHEFIDNILNPKICVIKDSIVKIFQSKEKEDAN
jgi:hypothetical protein